MLTRLHLQNFTVFADATFEFSPGLNVLVGTNGTGKSHVLKVGYAVMRVLNKDLSTVQAPLERDWRAQIALSLHRVFLTDKQLADLIRWGAGEAKGQIELSGAEGPIQFGISQNAEGKTDVAFQNSETKPAVNWPVFIPAKEILTNFPGFTVLYERYRLAFDATYNDLCQALSAPLLRSLDAELEELVVKTELAISGQVQLIGDRFFYLPKSGSPIVIDLAAEGIRRMGTLTTLLRNGSLTPETTLFWDEPEANLNPALLRKLAAVLAALARQGFQIILATHSLFLLKELHILSRAKAETALPIRYFGLNKGEEPNAPVTVTTVDDFELLPDIVALDEELRQSADFLDALDTPAPDYADQD